MLPPRRTPAATAVLLAATALSVFVFSAATAQAQGRSGACEESSLAVLASPAAPWKGAPLRVVFTSEKPLNGELSLVAPDGSIAAKSRQRFGGPPYFWFAEVNAPAAGKWRASLASSDCGNVAREVSVRADQPPRPQAAAGYAWPLRNAWDRGMENLFSAWVEKLFDAPLDAAPSWNALHEVLRDKSRNVLFNHLGLGEDEMKIVLRPDCADLPYFLRAYFAFKMGLPFGFSKCSRGGGGNPPACFSWASIQNTEAGKGGNIAASFGNYMRVVADGVHSGTGRTRASDDNTDYYPVSLTQDTLRPGTIYADPYGHILMLVKRVSQTKEGAGVFLAVDGQPDGTVARKRFWRGNFLYAQDPALGSPGFKRFRPIMRAETGDLRRLTNAEIARNPQYGDFSLEQSKLGTEEFYDRMDEVMSPAPLDPLGAMKEAITALEEQVKTRVTAVENGRKFQNSGKGEAGMPDGAAIFETTGPWEDFSTPARDFRLLIAIDVVRGYPDRVARHPDRYAMPPGKSVADVKAELESALAAELVSRKFAYTRSDGSQWTLSLKDVIDRSTELEMAYNPNDCVELRWAAADKSNEASTCKRHAPAAQRAKMTKYRSWFRQRHWPAHA